MRKKLIGLGALAGFGAVILILALDVGQIQGQPGGKKAAGGKKNAGAGGAFDPAGNPIPGGGGKKGGKGGGGAGGGAGGVNAYQFNFDTSGFFDNMAQGA
ncbi:MAG TPA: hypothetical protein VE988_04060, partial [Gemmataceae bacterium]|nr:hypothetical protein [Gemmataceae bacterium]